MTTDPAPFHAGIADGPAEGAAIWTRAADGTRLRVGLWPRADAWGTVLIFPGRTEYIEKYGATARDLSARGLAAVAVDWRGQGLADRPAHDRELGDVAGFAEYRQDVAAMLAAARASALPEPFFLLAHSMGGCIGLRALHDRLPVRAAAFSAPMWGIRMTAAARPLAWALSGGATMLGLGRRYAPGTGRRSYVTETGMAGNMLTSDAATFALMQDQLRQHPNLSLGGPSLRWLFAALREMRALRRLPPPALPALCAIGSDERVVDSGAVHNVMRRWPGGRLEVVPGAQHEILMEREPIRRAFLDEVTALFRAAA